MISFADRCLVAQMVDVGALIGAMEKFGVSDGVLVPVAEAVEARPSMTLDEVVSMLRSKGVSVVVAYRVKNALSALSDRLSSSSASVSWLCGSLKLFE
jgi:hypothetical protein